MPCYKLSLHIRIHTKYRINEINKYLLSVYHVPGPVLSGGEPSDESKGKVSTFRACAVERAVTLLK